MLRRLRYWIRGVVRRSAVEREMHDEMRYHLEQKVALLTSGGLSRDAAEAEARREFGNIALHEEHARDARGTQWVDAVKADVRFAFRYFRHKPLASATIVLVLALGIGGHAFQFSMLVATTMRTAPGVPRDIPLVRLRGMQRAKQSPEWLRRGLSYPELGDLARLNDLFSRVAAWTSTDVVASTARSVDGSVALAHFVTDDYFPTLRIQPLNGPGLRSGGASPTAVISYAMWQDAFDRGGRGCGCWAV